MSAADNGGPAFPSEVGPGPDGGFQCGNERWHAPGMTLRDHFAGRALPAVFAEAMQDAREGSGLFSDPGWRVGIALDAYAMADAMLKARAS